MTVLDKNRNCHKLSENFYLDMTKSILWINVNLFSEKAVLSSI